MAISGETQKLFRVGLNLLKTRLFGAFVNYGLGGFVPQIISFFLIPLYTAYIFPTEMGIVEIATTIQTLLILFMRSGMAGGISRYYFESGESQDLRDYMATTAISGFIISVFFLLLALLVGPFVIGKMFPEIPFHPYIDISILAAFFQIAPEWQRRLIQAREQSFFSAKISVTAGLVGVAFNMLFVIGFRMEGKGMIYATLVTSFIFFIYATFCLRKDLRGRFKMAHLKYALSYGLPLVPHHAAAWGQQFLGRWVLGAVATLEAVGNLSIASRLVSPILIVIGAFANSYSPVYFSWRSKERIEAVVAKTHMTFKFILILGAWAVVSLAIFGDLFVRYALANSYRAAAPVVGILAIWAWSHLIYTLVTAEIFYSKKTSYISTIFIVATSVNLSLVYFLGHFGPTGAAFAQMVGGLVSILLASVIAQKTFPLPFDWKMIFWTLIAVTLAAIYPYVIPDNDLPHDLTIGTSTWALFSLALFIFSGAHDKFKALLKSHL